MKLKILIFIILYNQIYSFSCSDLDRGIYTLQTRDPSRNKYEIHILSLKKQAGVLIAHMQLSGTISIKNKFSETYEDLGYLRSCDTFMDEISLRYYNGRNVDIDVSDFELVRKN